MPTAQAPQLSEVGCIELPVPLVEPPTWQTEHTVVEVTFLWAETPLGAVPIAQIPQLAEVRRTTIVPVAGVAGVAGIAGVARGVWQDEHAIMAALTPACTEVLGALPTAHVPQLSEVANTLPEKNVGIANVVAKTTALMNFFIRPPKEL